MSEISRLVFIERPDSIPAYFQWRSIQSGSLETVVSLEPAVESLLSRRGICARNTLSYLENPAHLRLAEKCQEIDRWSAENFHYQDGFGLKLGYQYALARYVRLTAAYCLWFIEILDQAIQTHRPGRVVLASGGVLSQDSPYIEREDSLLADLAASYCASRGIAFETFPQTAAWKSNFFRRLGAFNAWCRATLWSLFSEALVPWHVKRFCLKAKKQPILFTTSEYKMDRLAASLNDPDWPALLMSDRGPMASGNFSGGIWMNLVEHCVREDAASRRRLSQELEGFASRMEQNGSAFVYRDVFFGPLIGKKVRGGMARSLLNLHRRAAAVKWLMDTVKPAAVLSACNRSDDPLLGEICLKFSIPAMAITHGSHTPPTGLVERKEWEEQGKYLIAAPYPFTALQSPLAKKFLNTLPAGPVGLSTGPLLWSRADRSAGRKLAEKLFPGADARKIIVHAGTPKFSRIARFHIYETMDEYVQNVRDVSEAVRNLPDVFLIVRFRPLPGLDLQTLQALVPSHSRLTFSVDDSISAILGLAGLVVSFSSTVIEEALQSEIPVLLYGCSGRYKHLDAVEWTGESPQKPSAVYSVRQAKDLPPALDWILSLREEKIPENIFEPFRFGSGEKESLTDLWLKMKERAA